MHTRPHFRFIASLALVVASLGVLTAQDIPLTVPNQPDSLKFAVIGDSGTGSSSQYRVGEKLAASRAKFPFEFVLMLGDNLYGSESERDYQKKFEEPYKPILDAKVKFYAALGNHDDANQRFYKHFNMNGEKYYSFKPKDGVRVFALDTNYMDKAQLPGWRRSWPPAGRTGRSPSSTIRSTRQAGGTGPIWSCAPCSSRSF